MVKKNKILSSKEMLQSMVNGLNIDNSKTVVEWVINNKIKTEDGHLIHYDDRKYLVDMMNDTTPKQAIMASAQVSKTVSMYIKALYMTYKGLNTVYSMPTQDLRDMLTKSKLNRIIENSEIFRNNVSGDLNIKNAWDRMLFLVYTFGNAQVGYTTDLNIYDEVSRSNPQTIDILKARQLNSKYKFEWFISNPNMPHDLLHNTFLQSTQKHWAIRCQSCSNHQILNYDGLYGYKGNVCKERLQMVCQYCDSVLEPATIISGQWVERFRDREISGYWIHQMMRPTETLAEQSGIVKELVYEEKKSKSSFMNMFLGLPYSGSDLTVEKQLFLDNVVEPFQTKHYVTMGLDIGSATGHHYVIGSGEKIFAIGRAKDWKEVRQLLNRYQVRMCVIDQNPEYGPAKEIQAEFPGVVWRANYVGNKTEQQIKYDEETGLVHIARNLIFDQIVQDLNDGKYKFAFDRNDRTLDEFADHWGTLSKIPKLDGYGNPTYKWEAPEGAWDHFAHAMLYWTIANHRLEMLSPRFGILQTDDGEDSVIRKFESRDTFDVVKDAGNHWLEL